MLDERMTRQIGSLREETTRGVAEANALTAYSHRELDRRLRVLEETK